MSDTEHEDTINHLLDSLEEARIFAGAEFEVCANEHDYIKAAYFCSIRDVLKTYIVAIEDYKSVAFKTFPRCPICGKKTSEGAIGGKICFDCVNRKRGRSNRV